MGTDDSDIAQRREASRINRVREDSEDYSSLSRRDRIQSLEQELQRTRAALENELQQTRATLQTTQDQLSAAQSLSLTLTASFDSLAKERQQAQAETLTERNKREQEVQAADAKLKEGVQAAEAKLNEGVQAAEAKLNEGIQAAEAKREQELQAAEAKREQELQAAEAKREQELQAAEAKREQEVATAAKRLKAVDRKLKRELKAAEAKRQDDVAAAEAKRQDDVAAAEKARKAAERKHKRELEAVERKRVRDKEAADREMRRERDLNRSQVERHISAFKDISSVLLQSQHIQARMDRSIEAQLGTPYGFITAAFSPGDEEEKIGDVVTGDGFIPANMSVVYVGAKTFEELMQLMKDASQMPVPGSRVIPIGVPEDADAVMKAIQTAGNKLLQKKRRNMSEPDVEEMIGRDITSFEEKACFWTSADPTIPYQKFLNVIIDVFVNAVLIASMERMSIINAEVARPVAYAKEIADRSAESTYEIIRLETPECTPIDTTVMAVRGGSARDANRRYRRLQ